MPSNISEYILNARRFRPKDSNHPGVIQIVNQLACDIALGKNVKRNLHLKYLLIDLNARHKKSLDG